MFSRFFAAAVVGLAASAIVAPMTYAAVAEAFEGKVLTVSEDKHLTIKHQDDQRTFVINDDTKFTLDGEAARWEDLKPNFSVTVHAEQDGDKFVARSIDAYVDE